MNQLHALGWTLVCEVPLLILLARPRPVVPVLLVTASASLITHPLAWRVATVLSPDEYPAGLLIIETCIAAAEGLWLHAWLRAGLIRSLGWSLMANAASFLLGWMVLA
jgi:hypothetical protein